MKNNKLIKHLKTHNFFIADADAPCVIMLPVKYKRIEPGTYQNAVFIKYANKEERKKDMLEAMAVIQNGTIEDHEDDFQVRHIYSGVPFKRDPSKITYLIEPEE